MAELFEVSVLQSFTCVSKLSVYSLLDVRCSFSNGLTGVLLFVAPGLQFNDVRLFEIQTLSSFGQRSHVYVFFCLGGCLGFVNCGCQGLQPHRRGQAAACSLCRVHRHLHHSSQHFQSIDTLGEHEVGEGAGQLHSRPALAAAKPAASGDRSGGS